MSSLENIDAIMNEYSKSEDHSKDSEESSNTDFQILPKDYVEPDHVFKLIVIGDSGVGKTCLTYRLAKGKFYEKDYPTLCFEFFPILLRYKDKNFRFEI